MASPTKIVHIDDDPSICELTKEVLEQKRDHFEVITFQSPTKALNYIETNQINYLICDQRMPAMSGLETITEVQQRDSSIPMSLS